MRKALVQSCDVYFYKLGLELGVNRLAYYARALGLGARTGIELGGEMPGLVPTKEWRLQRDGGPILTHSGRLLPVRQDGVPAMLGGLPAMRGSMATRVIRAVAPQTSWSATV